MKQHELWDLIPREWQGELESVRAQINHISTVLDSRSDVLPARENIFRALQIAPHDVKVIVVGQDPYPNAAHACGLSFSVPSGTHPLPGSLRNIISEIKSDMGNCDVTDGDLEPWLRQGVMLLNRTLTVNAGKSDSHKDMGWAQVTDHIVKAAVGAQLNVVGVLWGKQAQALADHFAEGRVVVGVHPSPLSAHRGFLGSRPFSRVNQLLIDSGNDPIRW